MSPSSTILVSIDPNEAMRTRAELIYKALALDDHFEGICNTRQLPFDLQFVHENLTLHIEIKDFTGDDNSDYVGSILNGHLWEQCLAARELGEPMIIVVLGDDRKTQEAIRKAAAHPTNGTGFDMQKFLAYSSMVDGFEANCEGAHIRILHLGYNQFPRLLLRVRKILQGGDLSGFAPSPSNGERQAVGLSILTGRGIGPAKASAILEHFGIWLAPHAESYLTDCDGIGQKLAEQIARNVRIGNGAVVRPPKPKKAKLAEVLG